MIRACAIVAAAVAMLSLAGSASGGYAGSNGAITYDAGGAIFSLEQGKLIRLYAPQTAGAAYGALWSPNSRDLVFATESTIQVLNTDTARVSKVVDTKHGQLPSWSADGREIAYACDDLVSVCEVGRDGKLERRFATVAPTRDALWSPDGRIAYLGGIAHKRVYVANADGTGQAPVTPDETDVTSFAWSPDGSKIAYTDNANRLWTIASNGTGADVLDTNALGQRPSWSPNGGWIVFQAYADGAPAIVELKLDKSSRPALTDPSTLRRVEGNFPDWQRVPLTIQPPSVAGRPAIGGAAAVGATLTASRGTWNGGGPMTFRYAWQRCDAAGGACQVIAGATDQTYRVAAADAGARLRVLVTASNPAGALSSGSDATALIGRPNAAPAIDSAVAVWNAHGIRLVLTTCDDAPGTLTAVATDWNDGPHGRIDRKTRSWSLTAAAGCATTTHTWSARSRVGRAHEISLRVRDARGAWSTPVRVLLPG